MAKSELALFGGHPIIMQPFPAYRSIGEEEVAAAADVVRSGVLSGYVGARGDAFLGGPRVRMLEAAVAKQFGVRHAIAVNSWTSGLIAAVGALALEPGDEVIVTPWTMAASATAILHWNGIPVFADIEPTMFCIDPAAVERAISPYTKAIMAVDIFGMSADIQALRRLASHHNLKLISDTAQAPGALVGEGFAGTMADIGGYSLNYHKHIHAGEGGLIVTDDDLLARRMQLIRNHAEAVIESDDPVELSNMLGYNFRLGEIEAAIALEQLKKLPEKTASRQRAAAQLTEGLRRLRGLTVPAVRAECTHVYYMYGMILDVETLGVPRRHIFDALKAEGVTGISQGYQNLHRLPLFVNKIAYGSGGFPWTSSYCKRDVPYGIGTCPVAERLHDETFLNLFMCAHEFTEAQVSSMLAAFYKVWSNLDALKAA